MKKHNNHLYLAVLNECDIGLLVVGRDNSLLFSNKVFEDLMVRAALEFKDVKTAKLKFIESVENHRYQNEWLMRVNPDIDGFLEILRVRKKEFVLSDGSVADLLTVYIEQGNHKTVAGQTNFIFGPMRVDTSNESVFMGRKRLSTSPTEFRLITEFCQSPNQLLLRPNLLKAVWNKRSLHTRTLDVYISRLNQKMLAEGARCQPFIPIHGRGYLFQPSEAFGNKRV